MPFGVTNALVVFQHLMQRVLSELQMGGHRFISAYLDNVIIFSSCFEDHMKHLKMVFDPLRGAGLMLNPLECKILCEEVEYLGHVVTSLGLRPNNWNLDSVSQFPRPTSLEQLRQYLGLTSHYQRFIPNYANIANPLHALTHKGAHFCCWTSECEVAFEDLGNRLLTSPIMAYPDFNKEMPIGRGWVPYCHNIRKMTGCIQ